jgi:hypothetical protein
VGSISRPLHTGMCDDGRKSIYIVDDTAKGKPSKGRSSGAIQLTGLRLPSVVDDTAKNEILKV